MNSCVDCSKPTQGTRCRPCHGKNIRGSNHPQWKGGRYINDEGYVILHGYHDHPNAWKNSAIREHVLVMSNYLGRPLAGGETVHHKNGIRTDNRIENLELWVTTQPSGQRPEDLVKWAKEILERYGDE